MCKLFNQENVSGTWIYIWLKKKKKKKEKPFRTPPHTTMCMYLEKKCEGENSFSFSKWTLGYCLGSETESVKE